jgi:predicted transposase/invertase (TIGR01784 family)
LWYHIVKANEFEGNAQDTRGDLMGTKTMVDIEREEELQAISKLRLLDDDLMRLVFDKNIEATELLLNVILQRNDLKVLEVVVQREYKNAMAGGRSITIDIYAIDSEGKVYDIKIQRMSEGADVHRARFHSSMIDTRMLKKRQKFKELHDSYVIFITEEDVIGAGLSLYHVERVFKETGASFGDGSHIIYVNGSYKNDEDPVGKLMHDFRCTSSVDMYYPILANQVRYFKETEGGKEIMCKTFEELADKRAEKIAEKIAEERAKEREEARAKENARRMLAMGKLTYEEIAECTDLPVEEIRNLESLQLA